MSDSTRAEGATKATFPHGREAHDPLGAHAFRVSDLQSAILQTVAYSDLFGYPLTAQEVHRYLVGVPASSEDVRSVLEKGQLVPRYLSHLQGYFALPGRESLVQIRIRRSKLAARLWPKAVRYGLTIASLPFVRMVAVTGTLAVNNVDVGADIDYLIVTEPRRLWLVRSLVIALVRLVRLEHLEICPNYLVTLDAMGRFSRSLFTAHELAQMVPLYGWDVYCQLLGSNDWARRFLPNAFDLNEAREQVRLPRSSWALKRATERILASRLGDIWEGRESRVKIRRLRMQAEERGVENAMFTPQLCKGHLDDHSGLVARLYAQRMKEIDLPRA